MEMNKCKNCKWWVRIADWGDCRKRAPTTQIDTPTGIYKPIWPQPMSYEFCDEFEVKK